MKLSKGIQNFWLALANYIVLSLMLFLYLLASNGWKLTNLLNLPDLMGLTIIVALTIFPVLWFLGNLKTQLLQAIPDEWNFKVAVINDYPELDLDSLKQQTSSLEDLGFVQLMDYNVEPGNGFARSFAHPQHHCFVEIGQLFTVAEAPVKTHCSIFSSLSQDWGLTGINRKVSYLDAIPYIWRHPKSVRIYHPELNMDELLQEHLKFRQQMINNLNISVSTDMSWSAYRNLGQQATIFRKMTMRRKNLILAMLEATFFEINPKSQWLGDYAKVAANRGVNT